MSRLTREKLGEEIPGPTPNRFDKFRRKYEFWVELTTPRLGKWSLITYLANGLEMDVPIIEAIHWSLSWSNATCLSNKIYQDVVKEAVKSKLGANIPPEERIFVIPWTNSYFTEFTRLVIPSLTHLDLVCWFKRVTYFKITICFRNSVIPKEKIEKWLYLLDHDVCDPKFETARKRLIFILELFQKAWRGRDMPQYLPPIK